MNTQRRDRLCGYCLVLGLALTLGAVRVVGQSSRYIGATITGTAYAFSGRSAGRTAPFRLIINRYSSADEVQRLNQALQLGGQEALLKALSDLSAG
jgi:hypothetical protein